MTAATSTPTATQDPVATAHARLLADHSFQFGFSAPPPPPQMPGWLIAFGRWLARAAPYLQWVFWGLLAVGVLVIAALLVREFLTLRRPAKAEKKSSALGPETWRPSAARAKALLADADRLAAAGRYDEAVHVLLYRSIDDIEEKRPRLVATSHTSRDIVRLNELPPGARSSLDVIVKQVERNLFGGLPLDSAAFAECRHAYETFAFPQLWAKAA